MKNFVGLFCRYDPDAYVGHRIHRFEAESLEAARTVFEEWLKTKLVMVNGKIEMQVYEYVDRNGPSILEL